MNYLPVNMSMVGTVGVTRCEMAEKRYYWLKLHKNFFKRHEIRIIEDMPNGKDYILFYLKLLVESVTHEGNLRFSDAIPYNEQMLATITNTNVDIVKAAMQMFLELNMIEVLDDQTIYMAEVEEMIGSETEWAKKKRLQRAKKDNVPELSQNCPTESRDKSEENRDKISSSTENKTLKIREQIDWSDYDNRELTTIYPFQPQKDLGLTIAEADMLERLVVESALERYYIKVAEYECKDVFATIIQWAKQDMNYKGE